ncbi:MAG: VacJ family lipoprotein [Rhodospirillales bacterium]|nr:VacJ family lipoprotein [Rhodospirillales bacterium]
MGITTLLERGLQNRHWMGRAVPALFACALLVTPVSDAIAGQADVKPVRPEIDRAQKQEIAKADLSPATQKFLVTTAQLAQAEDDQNDPFEGFNRAMFSFNEGFYDVVMRPVSNVYNFLPPEMRTMIGSFLSNLNSPVVFVNDILQGELRRALTTAGRFAVNSTFGFGGIADVASSMGFEKHDEDFGQTLAIWGVGEGFYLVLPILGPSNPRDAIGRFIVDPLIIDPFNQQLDDTGNEEWMYGRFALSSIDRYAGIRDELDQIKKTSVDYYAAIRSLYRQKRKAEIANGEEMDLPPMPDFEFGDGPDSDQPDSVLGDNGMPVEDEDQAALREFERAAEEKIIQNPFEVQFVPAVGAHEVADSGDTFRPAPRKPAEFDWVGGSTFMTGNDAQVAEMSWEAVVYIAPR